MRASGFSLSRAPVAPPAARVASIDEGEVLRLRAEVERLSDELVSARYELDQILMAFNREAGRMSLAFGLTRGEAKFLAVLVDRGEVSREGMDIVLYGDESRGNKALDVWLCKVRAKVGAVVEGLEIETIFGWGWRMSDDSRARVRAAIGEDA